MPSAYENITSREPLISHDIDTSYSNGNIISFPAAAASTASYAHPKFQPPAEMTPPPSPPVDSPASPGIFKLGPGLLSRAGSVISRRQSASTSPSRPSAPPTEGQSTFTTQQANSSNSNLSTASKGLANTQQARRRNTKSSAFADFFTGSSELVTSFGMPAPLKRNDASPTRAIDKDQRRPSLTSTATNLFTRSSRSASPRKSHPFSRPIAEENCFENDEADEFLNLDLEDELFPGADAESLGSATEAFDTLFANAERLFMRMQIAYQAKHSSLADERAMRRLEREELDEAQERNGHLKGQIDAMGRKVREQEETLAELTLELGDERALRRKEAERRTRSLRIVDSDESDSESSSQGGESRDGSEGRSSVDSRAEGSEADGAIWSRPESPSESISTMPEESEVRGFSPGDFGGGLREENMRLKARVRELEETVDGCLGLVHGL